MNEVIHVGNVSRDGPNTVVGQDKTAVIAIVGITSEAGDLREEIHKGKTAEQVGANMIADVSTVGEFSTIHSAFLTELSIPLSTVPFYEVWRIAADRNEWPQKLSRSLVLDVIEKQAELGVDCMTIHAAHTISQLQSIQDSDRRIQLQARGGGLVNELMRATGHENPLYEYFEDILAILKKHGVAVSIGCSCRTGTVNDPIDALVWQEAVVQAQLVRACHSKGVAVMVEGLSHIRYGLIKPYVRNMKILIDGAPLRLLGPIATEKGLGYDHITSAIGATEAVAAGVDALTCVTRSEHIGVPSAEDLREAVVAMRIAIEIGKQDWRCDSADSSFQCGLGFTDIRPDQLIDYTRALELKLAKSGKTLDTCDMCNDACPIKRREDISTTEQK